MKPNNSFLILLILLGAVAPLANADDVRHVTSDGPIEVLAVLGKANELFFEEGISTLVRSGQKDTLIVEQTANHLFVTPLSNNPADLTVIDTQGQSFKLHFIFEKGYDEKIVVNSSSGRSKSNQSENSTVNLIRDLALGRTPKGSTEKPADKLVFDNGQIRLHLIMVYEMPKVLCYVMVVENLLKQSIIVPVQQVGFPNLLAVGSERDMLTAKGTDGALSKVYMVVSR